MMNNPVNEIVKKPYMLSFYRNEDGIYSGEILEFPGCFGQGETIDSAMDNLMSAAESWVDAAIEQGLEIPEPYESQSYNGKIALRLPKSLHKQAIKLAEIDGISLNQFLVDAVAEKVGAQNLYTVLLSKFTEQIAIKNEFSVNAAYQIGETKTSRGQSGSRKKKISPDNK